MRFVLRSLVLVGLVASLVLAGRSAVVGGDRAAALRSPGGSTSAGEAQSPLATLLAGRQPSAAAIRARRAADPISFSTPVNVSTSTPDTQAAEPSIRVDTSDPNKRIWIAAPTGLGARTGFGGVGGDLFWHSDDNGLTWTVHLTSTIIGGGDSDVITGVDSTLPGGGTVRPVYVTGLTLANVTLAASCDNGGTWTTTPVSNVGTVEDRQWLDMYEDAAKPVGAPDFLLNFGRVAEGQMVVHQVVSPPPACSPPEAGPAINVSHPSCPVTGAGANCYQWPGNLAVDEATGDVYVTHNTLGSPDDVVVARVVGGASTINPAPTVEKRIAANDRPDTFDSFTVVAVDTASNVYVVWTERYPALGETWSMYAYSKDKGVTWSPPIKVNQVPKTTTFPWIVAGGDGKIDIVYFGTSATGPSPEAVPSTSRWQVYMAQSLNATSASPTFTEVTVTGDMHQGLICTSGTGCAAGTRDLLDFFMIDVDEKGFANIAYTDSLNPPGADDYVVFVQQNGGPGLLDPTAVTLRSLDARAKRRGIELRWRTGAEPSLLGFNVFRSNPGAREKKVNSSLIRARGSVGGASYRLVDRNVRPSVTYLYRLQTVSRDGTRSWDRSIRVTPR